jgi:phage/plasmid-associated DNA primase
VANHLDEFFTWFCTGAFDWYSGQSLTPTTAMVETMNEYILENDPLAEFIEDTYTVVSDGDYGNLPPAQKRGQRTSKAIVYQDFCSWISSTRRLDDGMKSRKFQMSFAKKVSLKKVDGTWFYLCMAKQEDVQEEESTGCPLD